VHVIASAASRVEKNQDSGDLYRINRRRRLRCDVQVAVSTVSSNFKLTDVPRDSIMNGFDGIDGIFFNRSDAK